MTLVFHSTPEGAERTYRHIRSVTGCQEQDGMTVADAVSITTAHPTDVPFSFSFTCIRQQTVTVLVGMTHDRDHDVTAGLREFARMLALGIDEFVRSQDQ
jgi:hypothetical protein